MFLYEKDMINFLVNDDNIQKASSLNLTTMKIP